MQLCKGTTEAFLPQLENYDYPLGYSYRIGGELETQSESFGDLSILLIVAMIGIFAVSVLSA